MWIHVPLSLLVTATALVHLGCGTYEFRKRPDNSEVAVIRDIADVFKEFANDVTVVMKGLEAQRGNLEATAAQVEVKQEVQRLYQMKDQLNAQLRDFVVARYQSYINAELDPDPLARNQGRKSWNDVTKEIQKTALELRRIEKEVEKKQQELTAARAITESLRARTESAKRFVIEAQRSATEAVHEFSRLEISPGEGGDPKEIKIEIDNSGARLWKVLQSEPSAIPAAQREISLIHEKLTFLEASCTAESPCPNVVFAREDLNAAWGKFAYAAKSVEDIRQEADKAERELKSTLSDAVSRLKDLVENLHAE